MYWVENHNQFYLFLMVAGFLGLAVWETKQPWRPATVSTGKRWGVHGLMVIFTSVFTSLILRLSPVALAFGIQDRGWGLLNQPFLPTSVRWIAAIFLLDLYSYFSHRLFHRFEWLWRIHQVHHSDTDYDVSTGARFHPIESALDAVTMLGWVALLAPPPGAVAVSQLIGAAVTLLLHTNVVFSEARQASVEGLLLTPRSHRIHHSQEMADQNTNYGLTFSLWDRCFGTFRAVPQAGETMKLGVEGIRAEDSANLGYLLGLPFKPLAGSTPLEPEIGAVRTPNT